MRLNELITLINKEKEEVEKEIVKRKSNISSTYYFAKHDFRCIDNFEDQAETYCYILEKLEDLQDRIIERNKINIDDL